MAGSALLMSIKPEYANMIFSGEKTIELRRTRPNCKKGDLVIVYVSSPVKAIQGFFEIEKINWGRPETIWKKFNKRTGVSQEVFQSYFDGVDVAYGIELKKVWKCETELALSGLREKLKLEPPQSFRYLSEEQLGKVFENTQAI